MKQMPLCAPNSVNQDLFPNKVQIVFLLTSRLLGYFLGFRFWVIDLNYKYEMAFEGNDRLSSIFLLWTEICMWNCTSYWILPLTNTFFPLEPNHVRVWSRDWKTICEWCLSGRFLCNSDGGERLIGDTGNKYHNYHYIMHYYYCYCYNNYYYKFSTVVIMYHFVFHERNPAFEGSRTRL